jgi:hypothetical protein
MRPASCARREAGRVVWGKRGGDPAGLLAAITHDGLPDGPPAHARVADRVPEEGRPPIPIFLVGRAFDPNAGKAPTEASDTGYVDVILSENPELKAFCEEVHGRSHLGGTCLPVQAMPEGLTPFYLELEDEIGGANFGGGNMQARSRERRLRLGC